MEDSQSSHSDSDSGDRYEVEVILQHRTLRGQRRYLVKWKGYGHQANSWLTERQLRHAPDLLMEYQARNPDTERPGKAAEGSTARRRGRPRKSTGGQ